MYLLNPVTGKFSGTYKCQGIIAHKLMKRDKGTLMNTDTNDFGKKRWKSNMQQPLWVVKLIWQTWHVK